MNENEIKALIKAIDRLLGDPLTADATELDSLFAEFGEGRNPAQLVADLAAKAAQRHRLNGTAVPSHVAEALKAAKRSLRGESTDEQDTVDVIERVLNPLLGPVQEVSYAFRNRKERTAKDTDLLERLSGEVKRDWSKDKQK
jgi:hypothetical protein